MTRISRAAMTDLHSEIHQDPVLRAALDAAVASGAVLASASGNAGDGLIHLGAYELLKRFGDALPVIGERDIANLPADKPLIVVGSGMIEGIWDERMRGLRAHLAAGGEVIFLACTIFGFEDMLRAHASQITLFARDAKTHTDARAAGVERAYLTHDLAFAIAPAFFDAIEGLRSGEMLAFRTDAESANHPIPFGNLDLSVMWNGDIWQDRATTEARARLLAQNLASFAKIKTDRLHLGILGAALGLEVEIYNSISPKIQGIYHQSLHRLPNVTLVERDALESDAQETQGASLLEYARDLARLRRDWYEPELARLSAAVTQEEAQRRDWFEPELARLSAAVAQEEALRREWFEPEMARLSAAMAQEEALRRDWFEPELARLSAAMAQEEAQRRDWFEPEMARLKAQILHQNGLGDALQEAQRESARLQARLAQYAQEVVTLRERAAQLEDEREAQLQAQSELRQSLHDETARAAQSESEKEALATQLLEALSPAEPPRPQRKKSTLRMIGYILLPYNQRRREIRRRMRAAC